MTANARALEPKTRAQRWERLAAAGPFDLAVIGGGATGLGVALDAALRGFSVVLLESHDFASGTSSRSTKLLHGGVRYLAQGNIALVREALAERATVLHLAPHLAQPLAFVMPSYRWWEKPWYGLGLTLYDLMAGSAGLGTTALLSREQTLQALPGVQPKGLRGGVRYWDGQFDDARLALALVRSAEEAGAQVFNHAEVTALNCQPPGSQILSALAISDRITGQTQGIQAHCVVNAAGVWVDGVRDLARTPASGSDAEHMVSPSQGVHVVVDRSFLAGEHALLVPKTRDGRVLFVVPWLGKLILGTTDTPRNDLAREPQAFAEELDFILREAGGVLVRPVRREDVRSLWVGLRPLVAQAATAAQGTKTISREHTIVVDANGLLTVTGGKWTTYRAMAEDVLDRCMAHGLLPKRQGGHTALHRLWGAPPAGEHCAALHQAPGGHCYGVHAQEVHEMPGAMSEIGMGLTEAMVRYAVRQEHAQTVEDVLARRWRALFLDARTAAEMAPEVAAILASEQIANPQLESFLALCRRYLPSGVAF